MKVITLTLNPAIDVHLEADGLEVGSDNKCKYLRRDSGGKGVNLSRALWVNGVDSLCYMLLGGDNAEEFLKPLTYLGMSVAYRILPGRVRENINLHHGQTETVIATDGPIPDGAVLASVLSDLSAVAGQGSILAFSGRIADGTDKEQVISMLLSLKDRGVRLALDSKSLGSEDLKRLKPYIIKPNYREALALLGKEKGDGSLGEWMGLARRLYGDYAEQVLLTLGGKGAVLVNGEGVFYTPGARLDGPVLSTVGAGDSSLAGYIAGLAEGGDSAEALRLSMAYGGAACLTEGTLPPRPEDVALLRDKIDVYSY